MSQAGQIIALDQHRVATSRDRILELLATIPEVTASLDEVLVDVRPDGRVLHEWWRWSRAIVVDEVIMAVLTAHRRDREHNEQYPVDCVYIGGLAVDPQQRGRGHASTLLESLIADVGPTDPGWVCLQTNAADWNEPVRALYRRHGFVVAGEKTYDDRRDVIMRRAIWPAAERVFTRAEAQGLSGLSPRETADWARAGVVAASRADSGRGLTFTGHEVLVLCVIARLRAAGVDFSTIREIAGSVAGRSTVTVGGVVVDCDAERDRIGH